MASAASSTAPGVKRGARQGVAPLRAGQGTSFFLRRLHSLTGIVPVGAFLFEHVLISNSTAITGPDAYARQVSFLANLPLVFFLELFGIWMPIAFHALYGFYIWYRGDGNTVEYPWTGNWMYTLQRWTGGIVFFYIVWHTWTMRFSGVDLHEYPNASFGKVQAELMQPRIAGFLCGWTDCGVLALCLWHLAVLCQVGDHFRREGATEISGRVLGTFCGDEPGWAREFVYLPGTLPATRCGAGHACNAGQPVG